jgi:predicted MFS family arabinose efflux permease
MTVSTFVVPVYGALSRFLIAEFDISRAQLGWLITSVTAVAAVMAPAVGRWTDRLGGSTMILTIFVGSIVLMLAVAVAPTFETLLLTSLLAGFINAAGNPAGNKLIVSVIPRGARGVIMGIKQSGVQLGTLLVGALLPGLALAHGWRTAVALTAILPAAAAVWAWHIKRNLNEPRKQTLSAEAALAFDAYRHPSGVRRLALYAFTMGAGVASQAAFLPLYAQERLGLSVTQAGLTMAVIGITGIGSRILWSRSSEHTGNLASPLLIMAALSVLSISSILAASHYGQWLLWAGALLSGTSVVAWNGVANLGAVLLVDESHAGHASGFVVLGFLGGFAAAPPLFGYSVEHTGSYDLGWACVLIAFAFGAVLMHMWNQEERRARLRGGSSG